MRKKEGMNEECRRNDGRLKLEWMRKERNEWGIKKEWMGNVEGMNKECRIKEWRTIKVRMNEERRGNDGGM